MRVNPLFLQDYDLFYLGCRVKYSYFFQTSTNATRVMKCKNAIRMPLALILRVHTTALVILHILGMVLNAKVRLACHKLF